MENREKVKRSYLMEDLGCQVVVHVCVGSACHLKGSYDVISEFKKYISSMKLQDRVKLKGAFCLNECTSAVSMKINESSIEKISAEDVKGILEELAEVKQWNI